jgi:hypothetical protein
VTRVWGLVVAGLLLFGVGLLAYLGVIKGVVVNGFPTPYLFFGVAWLGASGVLNAAGLALGESGAGPVVTAVAVLIVLAGIGAFVVAMVSFFWLPRFLLPRWFLEWREGATVPGWSRRGVRRD